MTRPMSDVSRRLLRLDESPGGALIPSGPPAPSTPSRRTSFSRPRDPGKFAGDSQAGQDLFACAGMRHHSGWAPDSIGGGGHDPGGSAFPSVRAAWPGVPADDGRPDDIVCGGPRLSHGVGYGGAVPRRNAPQGVDGEAEGRWGCSRSSPGGRAVEALRPLGPTIDRILAQEPYHPSLQPSGPGLLGGGELGAASRTNTDTSCAAP